MASIVARGLRKAYGTTVALDGLDLCIGCTPSGVGGPSVDQGADRRRTEEVADGRLDPCRHVSCRVANRRDHPQRRRQQRPVSKVSSQQGSDDVADGKVVHVPYATVLAGMGAPKPAHELSTILEKAGVPRDAEIICFADDPAEAAVNYFVLRPMGFPHVQVLVL